MFSYTFLMIDDLKKIENLRLFTIFHFSWHSVTIFKYIYVHKEYENFYSTLELLLIIHGQYYFQNILFAKHHYLNDILLILTLIETRLTTLPKQTNLKFLFLFSLFQSISSNRKSPITAILEIESESSPYSPASSPLSGSTASMTWILEEEA